MTSRKSLAEENQYREKTNIPSWTWWGVSAIALISATLGGLFAVSLTSQPLLQTKLSPEEAKVFDSQSITGEGLKFSELTRPVNILVMGMSVLPTDISDPPSETKNIGYLPQVNSFNGLSDVMLLIRFNPEEKKIIILSIPRDTRVPLERQGMGKINAANVIGGPALSAETVSELLAGVEIDRYIRINVLGVGKLIDALGGVTVDVPYDMKYRDDSQHLYINLKAGKQHLNGDQTLQMLRYRNDNRGDIGRVGRQQIVMRALAEQSLNPSLLARLPQIIKVVQSHIDTNLKVEELLTLVNFGVQTGNSNMETIMLPGRASGHREFNASYWLPDSERIATMMAQYFNLENVNTPQTTDLNQPQIVIQDSTGSTSESLQNLKRGLQLAGYSNVSVSDSWDEPLEDTYIIAKNEASEIAEAIRAALGFGEVIVEEPSNFDPTLPPSSGITIILGQDWLEKQRNFETSY